MNTPQKTSHCLPRLLPELRRTYNQLIADLGHEIATFTEKHQQPLQCGPGCTSCCITFSVLPLEAAMIYSGLSSPPKPAAGKPELCVFLKNDLCSIYSLRPIICRTQGLALGYIDEESESIAVSACPVNFSADFSFSENDLFFLDSYNLRLAALNREYMKNSSDAQIRIPLADICDLVFL